VLARRPQRTPQRPECIELIFDEDGNFIEFDLSNQQERTCGARKLVVCSATVLALVVRSAASAQFRSGKVLTLVPL
jgi:hypothetical protein